MEYARGQNKLDILLSGQIAIRLDLSMPRTSQWSPMDLKEDCPRCSSTLCSSWLQFVNEAETELEVDALRRRVKRGRPYGSDQWIKATAKKLNLQSTLRSPSRPKKQAPQ